MIHLICYPLGPPINDTCKSRGIRVANLGSVYSEDVADVAVALLIGVVTKITKISAADRFVRTTMRGKRVGIVGLEALAWK
ncbi:hypothetical protein RYX36_030027 [Vicia faba]